MRPDENWVCSLSAADRMAQELVGARAAKLAELTRVLGTELVPAGFVITSAALSALTSVQFVELQGLADQVAVGLADLERSVGGAPDDGGLPLVLCVRADPRELTPGSPIIVAVVGLADASVQGLAALPGCERFAWDLYGRSLQSFGALVRGIPQRDYEGVLAQVCVEAGVPDVQQLDPTALCEVARRFQRLYASSAGEPFPQDLREQLRLVVLAMLKRSRMAPTDCTQAKEAIGAIVVQRMVLGAAGPTSATGVAFSRDMLTGAPSPSGEWQTEAQSWGALDEARAKRRSLSELAEAMPRCHASLVEAIRTLETHYGDMQETEFAIERRRLYVLDTRSARRPAQAMVRFGCDAVDEGMLTEAQALETIDADALDALLHPTFDPHVPFRVLTRGVAASPGAAKGKLAFTVEDAAGLAAEGEEVILIRRFADATDVAAFNLVAGVLTCEGGKTSHAALVARGMGCPAVVGAGELEIDVERHTVRCGDTVIGEHHRVGIDGGTGIVTLDDVPLIAACDSEHLRRVLQWADSIRKLEVRVNADTPLDAERGLALGAQGIGVCRTEHMFMHADREARMRAMILARTTAEREKVLADLLPLQQSDFEGLFEAMPGRPVTIRLLDPPLHEFLPNPVNLVRRIQRERGAAELAALQRELDLVLGLGEANPMLGTRGCRLGLLHPEIYEMQVEAMMRAARAVGSRTGKPPRLEVMVPLVDFEQELAEMRALIIAVGLRHEMTVGEDYTVGTMIELPRACLVAAQLASHAEFFSFGTNDLTQTALGFSRDDVEAGFLATYLERGIFDRSPFQTIDLASVGELVKAAIGAGRRRRPDIVLGVCGEHGGDPDSIAFFHRVGVDYVSCSLYRLPVARVAAAQAQITHPRTD